MRQVGSLRRRQRHQRGALVVAVLGAMAIHAAAMGGAGAVGMFSAWGGMGETRPRLARPAGPPVAPLAPSCDGDAVLAAAARLATCASPFVADRTLCAIEVGNRLESDRLRCHVDELPTVAMTLAPLDISRIEQIDPEPLLETLSPERVAAFAQAQQAQQLALVQEAERRKTLVERDNQVVEIAKPQVELAPEQTHFVADYDNRVERETVARGSDREEIVARSQPEALKPTANPREATSAEPPRPDQQGLHPDAPRAPGALSMRKPGEANPSQLAQEAHQVGVLGGSDAPRGDGSRRRRGDGLISSDARQASDLPAGGGGAGGGAPPAPNLRPSEQVLERAVGGGSVDHLDEVEEGEETALNTKQWVFATFFNRMKRRVHQNWDPVSVWARHDPTGQVYGFKTRVTRVRVTLNPAGELTGIIVTRPSGVDLLDDEAVRAFRAAQPFPNPPTGLVDDAGNITFEFGFHLDIGGGHKAEWKIFRAL